LELAKPGWLEAELERVQGFARGPDDRVCELERVGIQTSCGYLETLCVWWPNLELWLLSEHNHYKSKNVAVIEIIRSEEL